ncbi:MAG: HAD-IC family P-type ATPase, partial [Marinoscillum sp.]
EQVFAGGRQIGSQITLRLDRAVNNSELTQLWNHSEPSATPQHEAIIDKVSRSFTVIIMILASLSALFWYFHDSSRMWDVVASVLIVACPCALALALPFALGHGMRALGARGIYLKNARVLERLAGIREMIFDKTGTLTKNDPASIDYFGIALSPLQQSIIKTACGNSAHPLSKLVTSQFTSEIDKLPMDEFEEELGLGIRACVSGQSVLVGSSAWVGAMGQDKLHESRVYVSIGGNVLGFYRIKSHYRSGIFKTLTELKNSYKLHLLSGDNATEETNLKPYLDEYRFEQKPNDKLEYVQSIDQPCLMIGDGLNDAGALKAATVGIAVSEDIHQFSPGCDAIMEANQIAELGGIMNFANQVRRVVIVAFVISFLYNIIGLIFAMSGN